MYQIFAAYQIVGLKEASRTCYEVAGVMKKMLNPSACWAVYSQ